jgi:predicted O-methyltransferase YrrM
MRNTGLILKRALSEFRPRIFTKSSPKSSIFFTVLVNYRKFKSGFQSDPELQTIESLRKDLLNTKQPISKMEFGAGSKARVDRDDTELIADVCRISSKNRDACLLLYSILRTTKPDHVLEFGTCLGISAAYQALALKQNGFGKMITMEGSPARAEIGKRNLELLYMHNVNVLCGKFDDLLLSDLNQSVPFDYVFIDGNHQEKPTIKYYETVLSKLNNNGILVIDDIFWSKGMNHAWNFIKKTGYLKEILEYKGMGIGLVRK